MALYTHSTAGPGSSLLGISHSHSLIGSYQDITDRWVVWQHQHKQTAFWGLEWFLKCLHAQVLYYHSLRRRVKGSLMSSWRHHTFNKCSYFLHRRLFFFFFFISQKIVSCCTTLQRGECRSSRLPDPRVYRFLSAV